MEKMHYTMTIKSDRLAIAQAKGCESSICMPVKYAYQHMEDVSRIAKAENVAIIWTVIFE